MARSGRTVSRGLGGSTEIMLVLSNACTAPPCFGQEKGICSGWRQFLDLSSGRVATLKPPACARVRWVAYLPALAAALVVGWARQPGWMDFFFRSPLWFFCFVSILFYVLSLIKIHAVFPSWIQTSARRLFFSVVCDGSLARGARAPSVYPFFDSCPGLCRSILVPESCSFAASLPHPRQDPRPTPLARCPHTRPALPAAAPTPGPPLGPWPQAGAVWVCPRPAAPASSPRAESYQNAFSSGSGPNGR